MLINSDLGDSQMDSILADFLKLDMKKWLYWKE